MSKSHGERVIEGRTRTGLHPSHPETYPTSGERESRCKKCGSRVTETTSGWEAGHKYGCPERPSHLGNAGTGGGGSYHQQKEAGD